MRSYLNTNGCPSVDTLHLTVRNKPLPPASITVKQLLNNCGNRIYRYTAPLLPAASGSNVAATGYNWTLPTGPIGTTGVLDSGTVASRIIRIRYTSNEAATALDSIRVAYASSCGNSIHKAIKLTNVKRYGCGNRMALYEGENEDASWELQTYPNPFGSDLSVSVSANNVNDSDEELGSYEIFDTQGRLIETGKLLPHATINIGQDYEPGLYYFVAVIQEERKIIRVIKH